jgi:hypothetical protein
MSKNGNESDGKGKVKRDSKGRFVRGCPPGPGRKKKEKGTVSNTERLARLERTLFSVLDNHEDPKIQIQAIKAILTLMKSQLIEDEPRITVLDPSIQKVLQAGLGGVLNVPDIKEVEDG